MLENGLTELGVIILENNKFKVERSGEKVILFGVNDPSFQTNYLLGDSVSVMNMNIKDKMEDSHTILLSHRPELMEVYVDNGIDLVLSGHTRGGQFRFPLIGGVAAPNQGLFTKYDPGLYEKQNTTMIVSRGIGNSIIPIRFNNRPEVI